MRISAQVLCRGLTGAAAGLALVLSQAPAATASPTVGHAHRTVTIAGGETFHLNLLAGPTIVPAAGGTVAVDGAGYNTAQGIYVALCALPDAVHVGQPDTYATLPLPCLGGNAPT